MQVLNVLLAASIVIVMGFVYCMKKNKVPFNTLTVLHLVPLTGETTEIQFDFVRRN